GRAASPRDSCRGCRSRTRSRWARSASLRQMGAARVLLRLIFAAPERKAMACLGQTGRRAPDDARCAVSRGLGDAGDGRTGFVEFLTASLARGAPPCRLLDLPAGPLTPLGALPEELDGERDKNEH